MKKLALLFLLMPIAAIAQAITALPQAGQPLSGSEIIPLVQGGVTKQATVGSIPLPSFTGVLGTALPTASLSQLYGGTGGPGKAAVVSLGTGLALIGGVLSSTGTVTTANNLAGGTTDAIPYQAAPGSTTFLAQGTGVLQEDAGAPFWGSVPTSFLPIGTSGATIPLNNGGFTQSGAVVFTNSFALQVRVISSGSSDTVLSSDHTVAWNSATASQKTQALPTCSSGNAGRELAFKDQKKTASTYAIILTPASGTIEGGATYAINYNGQSLTIQCDGVSDWMVL